MCERCFVSLFQEGRCIKKCYFCKSENNFYFINRKVRLKSAGSGVFVSPCFTLRRWVTKHEQFSVIFWKPDCFHQQWCALSWISFFQSCLQDVGIWAGNSVKNIFSDLFLIEESRFIPWFIRHKRIPESWRNECDLGVSLEKVVLTESWKK